MVDHLSTRWVLATRGLPVGSGFNDAMVKAYGLRAFVRYACVCPDVKLASYVGDNGVARHGPWNNVKSAVCRAARALAKCLQEDMEACESALTLHISDHLNFRLVPCVSGQLSYIIAV